MQAKLNRPFCSMMLKIAASLCVLGAITSEAAAQRPAKAQENAIRSACLRDYMSHCSKVKPGPAGMACLQRNAASLSTGCRTALSAGSGGSAPVAGAQAAVPTQPADRPTTAQENALSSACSDDFVAHCSKVKPGSPAALACLQRNSASLSAKCQTALRAVGGGPAPAAGAEPAALPAPARDTDVAFVEAVSGRVIVFARGKPALLENSDMISDHAQLDLQPNSELRFCHFKANRLLILKGPARAMVSGDGVTDERGNPTSAAVGTCTPPVR